MTEEKNTIREPRVVLALKDLLEKYEAAKLESRKFEAIVDELRPKILELLPEDKEISMVHGVFYIQKRPTWTYSPDYDKVKKELKEKEKMERADGTATATYMNILYYRENKKE